MQCNIACSEQLTSLLGLSAGFRWVHCQQDRCRHGALLRRIIRSVCLFDCPCVRMSFVLARQHVTRPLNTPLWSACILFAMALSSGPCLHDDIAVHVHRLHVYSGVIKSYTSVFCASYSRTFRIPAYIKPTRVSMHVYPNKRMQVCM